MISLIVTIAVVGVVVWAITALVPMSVAFKKAIYVVAVICLSFYLLYAFGFKTPKDVPVPQVLH